MADIGDIQGTFDNGLFRAACQDVLRIVSVLSLDSTDVTKPRSQISKVQSVKEKITYLSRFFYMVFIKGFTPTVFDVLPYWFWRLLTTAIFLYRLFLLPFWLRLTGYGRYADWSDIGSRQPANSAPEAKPLKKVNLTFETNLSAVDFADPEYEKLVTQLYKVTTHLSPHSQCPPNPFTHNGFPGNFFDHLTGVYKILVAWKQPQYVVRSGLFHSVYGTFDYRYSLYDLREGREPLRALIGPGAEELSFAICTSDRIGLLHRLAVRMYGHVASMTLDGSSASLEWMYGEKSNATLGSKNNTAAKESTGTASDGSTYPKLIGELGPEGFPVQNHITQQMHMLSPDLFAQYGMVMLADFMEQGVIALGAPDSDICMFRFMRFRFWSDFVCFLGPYLRVMPAPFAKYMGKGSNFIEPNRNEVLRFKNLWVALMERFSVYSSQHHRASDADFQFRASADDRAVVHHMSEKYPYLAEPFIALAAMLGASEKLEVRAKILFLIIFVLSFSSFSFLTSPSPHPYVIIAESHPRVSGQRGTSPRGGVGHAGREERRARHEGSAAPDQGAAAGPVLISY